MTTTTKSNSMQWFAIVALAVGMHGAYAGGNLEQFVGTGQFVAPNLEIARSVPIFWDERCAQVNYTLDTIAPNAGTAQEIDIATVQTELQAAFDQWNAIPTSYIDMNITQVRTIGNGTRGFDFINELTFETPPGFTALASSPSVSLIVDATFTPGLDIDNDGDSDVFDPVLAGVNVCTDIDSDGDIEFPAGFYRAGTILDNDVQFGQNVLWETNPTAAGGADIRTIATHEFGHSHGLSHSLLNNIGAADASGSTMFPFIATQDPNSELAGRTLHTDDIAWSSISYPEGGTGPLSSLQPGDIAFNKVFKVQTGSVFDAFNTGILGASVYGRLLNQDRTIEVEAFAGKANLLRDPTTGSLFLAPIGIGAANGDFQLPLPQGNYELFVQSPDVGGAVAANVSLTGQIGAIYGLHGFDEEGVGTPNNETNLEDDPGRSRHFAINVNNPTQPANFIVNNTIQLQNFGTQDFGGTGAVLGQNDVIYATRYSNNVMLSLLESGAVLTTGLFNMTAFDPSIAVQIKRVALVTGRLNADGTIANIDTNFSYRQANNLVVQDGDLHPFYFDGAKGLSQRLRNELRRDSSLDLFLIVETFNNVPVGPTGIPPLLALDVTGPFGESFLSINGGPFQVQATRNWVMQLNLTPQ